MVFFWMILSVHAKRPACGRQQLKTLPAYFGFIKLAFSHLFPGNLPFTRGLLNLSLQKNGLRVPPGNRFQAGNEMRLFVSRGFFVVPMTTLAPTSEYHLAHTGPRVTFQTNGYLHHAASKIITDKRLHMDSTFGE